MTTYKEIGVCNIGSPGNSSGATYTELKAKSFVGSSGPLATYIEISSCLSSSGPAPEPPVAGLQLYALDGGDAYDTIDDTLVLRPLEDFGDERLPRQGRAYLFDGTDDFGIAATTVSQSGAAYTACAWIYPTELASGSAGFGRGVFASTSTGALLGDFIVGITPTGEICYSHWVTTGSNPTGLGKTDTGLVSINNWYHLAITWDGSSVKKIYLDGVEQTITSNVSASSGWGDQPFSLGKSFSTAAFHWHGRIRDVRIYSDDKSLSEINAIKDGDLDTTGLVAQYSCNEESGTIGYDVSGNANHLTLTNITQETFHATDTDVTNNPNNELGYRLSGDVYIPAVDATTAADGNALTVTGKAPNPAKVEVPCITGNGSNVYADLGSALMPETDNFTISTWYFHTTNDTTRRIVLDQGGSTRLTANGIWTTSTAGTIGFSINGSAAGLSISSALLEGEWHYITVARSGNDWTLTCNDLTATTSTATALSSADNTVLLGTALRADGSIADLRITTGGVTTYFPLQDGPGSSNTNRDLSYIKSDGTYGIVSNAIVNGTVSTIWANRTDVAKDWCVEYGGDIAANGAFLPGQISGSLASDGTAKTLAAGKFGNRYSWLNLNPFTAAEFNGRSIPTAYEVADDLNAAVTPGDSAFRRTASDGDDRILIYEDALTGDDLTDVEDYTT